MRERKVDDLPGQRRDTPDEKDPLRIFYESCYKQIPTSEMAEVWLMKSGLLPKEIAMKVLEKKQKKGLHKQKSTPSPAPPVKKKATATNSTSKQSKKRKSECISSEDDDSPASNIAASTTVESPASNVAASTTVESPASNVAEKNPSQDSNSFNSPFPVYSDFKPPTSPSPNAPNISLSKSAADAVPETAIVSNNGPAQLTIADEPIDEQDAPKPNDEQDAPKPNDEQDVPKPKSRPLSPYAMYEDLKPPTSPTPSFRNF